MDSLQGPRVRAAGVFFLGLFLGMAIGNYDVTKHSVQSVADQYGQAEVKVRKLQQAEKVVPQLKEALDCEHWRAEVSGALALQTRMVKQEDLPADCPHPVVTVPAK